MADCKEWPGTRNRQGYGMWGNQLAHRRVYANANGPIPPGVDICHSCDNPPCYEITHLFPGTQKENSADMVAKGRQAKGERLSIVGRRKLTEDEVRAVRSRYRPLEYGYKRLAKDFGVHRETIKAIVLRRSWTWLDA